MLRISWPIETEAPKKSVNMRRISAAPVNVTWSVCTVSVASSAKHAMHAVDVHRVDGLEVRVGGLRERLVRDRGGRTGHGDLQ